MTKKEISQKLREILQKEDTYTDGMLSRKKSPKHDDDIEVLLEHLQLLIADLRFNSISSRREMFQVRRLLED